MPLAISRLEHRPRLGIALMLAAWFFFSIVDTSAKWLVIFGLPAVQLAFMRYFGHLVISTVFVLRSGFHLDNFRTSHFGLVMLRAFLLVSATAINFFTMNYLSLPVISAIMQSSPVLVCLLAVPLLGERIGPWRWFAIVLGLVGVLVVIRPFGEDFHIAALLNCYNALSIALYSILTRRLAGVVATDTMQFYMGVLGTVALGPVVIFYWQDPGSVLNWALLIGMGVFAWFGHQLLTTAHLFNTASALVPFSYSFLIYLSVFSILVFGQYPDVWTIVGAGIVVFSGLIIWRRENR